jgi:predicted nucleotidyltransferase
MASTVEKLSKKGLIAPPSDVQSNTMYETIVGSVAYGVADELSDYDVNGFFIPAADRLFPHLRGQLLGFDKDPKAPKAFQEHHIIDGGREYDLNIYSITVYFRLCLDNNPNMMDTLYTPRECVLHSTPISEMVRERRDIFFHKKCWAKYKGYAYSQFHKMRGRNPEPGSKRHQLREQYGFDVKHAYHTVRLLLECEMILNEHTIDIQRHRSYLKAIRRGEVPQESIEVWYTAREQSLEKAYAESTLRAEPARNEVKQLLLDCLEHHYGSLGALQTVRNESNPERAALHEIQGVIERTLQ